MLWAYVSSILTSPGSGWRVQVTGRLLCFRCATFDVNGANCLDAHWFDSSHYTQHRFIFSERGAVGLACESGRFEVVGSSPAALTKVVSILG